MAFPTTDLDIEMKLDLNGDGVFDTDITSYVLARDGSNGISIERGGTPESGLSDPGSCDFQLNNRDGRFSPRNPNGPYYGQIGRNTLVQVAVKGGATYLHTLNAASFGASTPDSASLSITGDIDIRFDATLENWFAAGGFGGTAELCGKGELAAANRAWILMIRNDLLHFEWSADGTTTIQVDSTAKPLVPLSRRLAVRVTLDVNNGAGGNTVTFYTSDTIAGTWTQLGDPVVTAGVTSIKDEANAVNVGRGWPALGFDSAVGHIHGFQLRSGIAGSVVASPDFTVQADGATSFVDAQGNTWTRAAFPNSNITDLDVRFIGEMVSWPNRWDTSGKDIWVDCKAKGIMRRLDAGRTTLQSTLTRRVPTFSPVAYWPMEEESGSTSFFSPVSGVRPLTFTNITLAADNTLGGSKPLPQIQDGSTLQGTVPTASSSTEWHTEFVYYLTTLPATNATIVRFSTTGTARYWNVRLRTGNILSILITDTDGNTMLTSDMGPFVALGSSWNRVTLRATQNGANVDFSATVTRIGSGADGEIVSDTVATATCGRITGIAGGQPFYGAGTDGMTLGHISVWDAAAENNAYTSADMGFAGETAGARVDRICSEEDVDVVIHGWTSETELMGAQGPSTFLNILRDAADADEGLLMEAREVFAVKFVGLASLTNQQPTVTLTYPGDIQPGLQPEPDDLTVENDVTVTRTSGSSGRVEVTTGTLSVNAPPNGVNRYENSYELDLYSDDQPVNHAGWKTHLGTWDEERYSAVPVWVSATPALFGTLSLLDVGTVLRISNQQNSDKKLPPGDIDLLIKGYDEFLNQRRWEFAFNGVPYGPYRVALVQDPSSILDRFDTTNSVLQTGITETATSMNVTSQDEFFWTRSSSDFPFDITMGGERITVTNATGAVQDDFSDNQTDTWATADAGGSWTNTGGVAGNFDKTGGRGTHTLTTTNAQRVSTLTPVAVGASDTIVDVQTSALATGAALCGGLVARYTDSSNFYMARLAFDTAQGITLTVRKLVAGVETQLGTFTLAALHAATTDYRIRFDLSGTTLRARAWPSVSPEPAFWQISVTDSAFSSGGIGVRSIALTGNTNVNPIVSYDNFVAENPVTMTVTRSVNGVVKSHSAAAPVALYSPVPLALN